MKKIMLMIIVGLFFGYSEWGIAEVEKQLSNQEEKKFQKNELTKNLGFCFGYINDDGKIYLEIPLSSVSNNTSERCIAISDFNESLKSIISKEEKDDSIVPIESEKIKSLIKIKEVEKFEVYSLRGYEGVFKTKGFILIQNMGGEEFYPYVELDKEIHGVKPLDDYCYPSNPVIAIFADEKSTCKKMCKLMIEKSLINYDYKIEKVWSVLKERFILKGLVDYEYFDGHWGWKKKQMNYLLNQEELFKIQNHFDSWKINILEGNIDTDKEIELVVSASWGNFETSNLISTIFILDSQNKKTQVIDIIPIVFSKGDCQISWKAVFGIDIDNDGVMEFVIHDFPYDGGCSSIYKWDGKTYKKIYESYYCGG
ncbi:MAG: hypothetical protein ABIB46_05045 [bacterium]